MCDACLTLPEIPHGFKYGPYDIRHNQNRSHPTTARRTHGSPSWNRKDWIFFCSACEPISLPDSRSTAYRATGLRSGFTRVRVETMHQPTIGNFAKPDIGGVGTTQSRDELLAEIHRVREIVGRTPSRSEMLKYGAVSMTPYRNEFGKWSNALEAAGYTPRTYGPDQDWTNDEIVAELQRIGEEKDGRPIIDDIDAHEDLTRYYIRDQFGTWGTALQEAGYAVDEHGRERTFTKYSAGELIDELLRVAADVGRPPTKKDMNEKGEYVDHPYVQAFGSWTEALRTAGLPPRYSVSSDIRSPTSPYGSNWETQRQKALSRDRYRCQHCGETDQEHRDSHGQSLHVHHIYPVREFDQPENGNFLDNLITLCKTCHEHWESLTPSSLPDDWESLGGEIDE